MSSYRRTSHSLAVIVLRPPGVEEVESFMSSRFADSDDEAEGHPLGLQPLAGEPWWWLVAVRKGEDKAPSPDALPWDRLIETFNYVMSDDEEAAVEDALSRSTGIGDDLSIIDPKVQTVNVHGKSEVFFRALPQGRCDNHTHPPRASFLPRVLPPVAEGECLLELCELEAMTDYHLMLFNISDGTSPPEVPPKPLAEANARTASPPSHIGILQMVVQALCVLATVLAIAWYFGGECARTQTRTNYSSMALGGNEVDEDGVGGFHQTKVTNLFMKILKGMLISMTMFLPIVGPIGLIFASDVVFGTRFNRVKRSREEYIQTAEYKMEKLWQLIREIWCVVVNAIMIPFNMYTVQMMWATYCHSWYSAMGVDVFQDSSYSDLYRYGLQWQEVSGLELGGWVPGIVLSTLLLALELQNDNASTMFQKHRKRAEAHLNALTKGRELWMKLCKMDSRMFARSEEVPDPLSRRVFRLGVSICFGLLPHLWMWLRRGRPLWNQPMMWVTLVYLVNIAGVSTRFLALCDRIYNSYKNNCAELATFQALSWQEDMSTAIYDPFATRNTAVVEARKKLRDNIPRIACLKLEEPEDSKVWWYLRELVFIQIKDGRILMEMMVLISIYFALLLGMSSVFVMIRMKETTATTIVTALVLLVLLRFTFRALSFARDINSMYLEHTCLLHNIVAEMNMPLRPQMPLDSHLQQERFLLQVATLIEKQPPPETVASFAVTPQLFSLVVGIVGLLTVASLFNLVSGILTIKS